MENNDDLLARIRKSQQSAQLQRQFEGKDNQEVNDIVVQEGNEEVSVGFFKKYSFPIPPIVLLLLNIITPLVICGVVIKELGIDINFYEWNDYILGATIIISLVYWRACLNKWIEKKGINTFSRIVRIICSLQIYFWIIMGVIDLYRWYKL